MAFLMVKVVVQQPIKTDFDLGTKQELFYAQVSGSFIEKQGLQLSHHYQQINPKGDDGGRAENSKQHDKKLSLKVAYTPNEHNEYALAFSTQKGTKESPFYSGADSFERYWRWPMWDKDSIYFLSHTEFGAHHLTLNTRHFMTPLKTIYVLLMMPHSALKRKNRALIAITVIIPTVQALI